MKTTIWKHGKVTIYVGGNPSAGQVPEVTLELTDPQILVDTDKNIIVIVETK